MRKCKSGLSIAADSHPDEDESGFARVGDGILNFCHLADLAQQSAVSGKGAAADGEDETRTAVRQVQHATRYINDGLLLTTVHCCC